MNKYTIGIGKRVAAAVFAAGVWLSSAAAHADDGVAEAATAPAVVDAGTNRAIVTKSISVGGLRPGEAVIVTGRGAERIGPAAMGGAPCADAGPARGG